MDKRLGPLLIVGLTLFGFAFDFVLLLVTYLVLAGSGSRLVPPI